MMGQKHSSVNLYGTLKHQCDSQNFLGVGGLYDAHKAQEV